MCALEWMMAVFSLSIIAGIGVLCVYEEGDEDE
jgi:hypothetical protein